MYSASVAFLSVRRINIEIKKNQSLVSVSDLCDLKSRRCSDVGIDVLPKKFGRNGVFPKFCDILQEKKTCVKFRVKTKKMYIQYIFCLHFDSISNFFIIVSKS